MIGILTEKPSAARNFAKALGGQSGTYAGEQYRIVAARGHLYEFVDPEKQVPASLSETYKSWNLANLPWDERQFSWKRAKRGDVASTLKAIKEGLKGCDEVCIATDDDPTGEGELLAWEILDELSIRAKKWTRMYFTDEAPASIQTAFKDRKVIPSMDKDMDYVKAYYRSRWDFMSMQFTRIATKNGDGRAVLRQGRLKSAMVLLVGDQLDKVNNYKKVPFYQNRFRDENGVVYTNPEEPLFPDKGSVPNTYHASDVVVDSKTMKQSAPPKLLDLATLSSRLAGKGIKAKTVLSTYQKMYESQIVSYPRTEDKVITPEQFDELLPKVDAIARVVGVDPKLLTYRKPRKTHVKTGGAHGANRPGPNVPRSLSELSSFGPGAAEIYEILARNYLAMLAPDYEYEQQKGHVKEYPTFTGAVNVPKKLGWKAVFDADEVDDDESSQGLGKVASPFVYEGFPPKPQAPTMKWLMKQLEMRDVGTGATRTSIYAEVTNERAKYPLLIEKRGKISMSKYGDMSYCLLPGTHIGDLGMTEQLMGEMRDIAAGKADPEACLAKVKQMVVEDMKTMEANGKKMRKELGIMSGGNFEQKEKYEGTWSGRVVKFSREQRGYRLTDEECETLLSGGKVRHTFTSKAGKPYTQEGVLADLEYNGHKYVGVDWQFPSEVPDEWCKHKFTDDEKAMLEAGKSIAITGCVSKKGNTFDCKVHYGKNDRGFMGIIPEFD